MCIILQINLKTIGLKEKLGVIFTLFRMYSSYTSRLRCYRFFYLVNSVGKLDMGEVSFLKILSGMAHSST